MNSRHLLLVLAPLAPGLAFAQGSEVFQCSYGELERRVEILHETEMSVPCEVHYYKDSEAPGERAVLWSATNEVGYCEKMAGGFIAKLEGWGWDCGQVEAAEPAPEESDDTEALTSAEEAEAAGED